MYAKFTLNGSKFRVLVPPQYYAEDMDATNSKAIVQKDVLKNTNSRIVDDFQ